MKKLINASQILTGADVPNWDCYLVFIPRHMIMAGYYGITLAVFSFPDNVNNCQWIFAKLSVCFDIVEIWFGIVNVQIHQFLTELSARDMSKSSFLDDNFSKCQWIFTKLGVFIDIVKIWFGIADGQISSIFDSYLHFWMITLVHINGFSPNLVYALY